MGNNQNGQFSFAEKETNSNNKHFNCEKREEINWTKIARFFYNKFNLPVSQKSCMRLRGCVIPETSKGTITENLE